MATIAQPVPVQQSSRGLIRLAWATLWWNVLVVLWGAVVRATSSGAGCGNHWPLCNGEVIPHSPRTDTVIEFTHRMMTGGAAPLVLGLLIWVLAATPRRHPARWATVITTLLLVNEAVLGMLLVKRGYVTTNRSVGRVVLLAIHFSNTFLLLAGLTMVVYLLCRKSEWRVRAGRGGLAIIGLLATLIVGVSGSLAALGDTLFPATSLRAAFVQEFAADAPTLLRLRSVHPLSAFVAGIFVLWMVWKRWGSPLGKLVAGLLVFQMLLGFADLALLAPTWMQVVHLLGADLYWVALVWLSADMVAIAGQQKAPATPARRFSTSQNS